MWKFGAGRNWWICCACNLKEIAHSVYGAQAVSVQAIGVSPPNMPFNHIPISSARFTEIGSALVNSSLRLGLILDCSMFQSLFGVSLFICAELWTLLQSIRPLRSRPVHLLGLFFF